MNHPALADDPAFRAELAEVALNKPSNSDIYTDAAGRVRRDLRAGAGRPGAAAPVLRRGRRAGRRERAEDRVRLEAPAQRRARPARASWARRCCTCAQAFHGRSGYTLSLTNTDPVKTALFPTFDWPRIDVPAIHFPMDVERRARGRAARALAQARAAFAAHPHDIACFIAEPIQGEGGDNHMRAEFLQAMQRLCRENDALFVLDEVQTGCGMTGTAWAYQQLGLQPDVVAFGKKLQVCGIMAGGRVDEVPDNVFRVSSRHQLHLGRQPHRHGALPALPGGHRGRRPDRAGRACSASGCSTTWAPCPGSTTCAGAGCSSRSTCPTRGGARRDGGPAAPRRGCWCCPAASARSGCARP